jgi:hypothetical protein
MTWVLIFTWMAFSSSGDITFGSTSVGGFANRDACKKAGGWQAKAADDTQPSTGKGEVKYNWTCLDTKSGQA